MSGNKEAFSPPATRREADPGTKRKRTEFVTATQDSAGIRTQLTPSTAAGDRYLSIAMKNSTSARDTSTTEAYVTHITPQSPTKQQEEPRHILCDICKLPVGISADASNATTHSHEASIAHMVCLEHSHPPSSLDRSRIGLKYLSSYGWDPDSRLDLGASGEGIRAPIKVKITNDTVGLGVRLKEDFKVPGKKKETLDAKQARRKDLEDKRKREKLQEIFYNNDDVAKYLGKA